jgi:hypothetical protein
MPTQKLDRSILQAAIVGLESQKRQIDTRIAELRQRLDGGPTQAAAAPQAPVRKRKVSVAAIVKSPYGDGNPQGASRRALDSNLYLGSPRGPSFLRTPESTLDAHAEHATEKMF